MDEAPFDEVQKVLKHRKITNHRGMYKTKYLLSGQLVCGHCGYSINGNVSFNRNKTEPSITYRHSRSIKHNYGIKGIPVLALDTCVVERVRDDFTNIYDANKYQAILINSIKKKSKRIGRKNQNIITRD